MAISLSFLSIRISNSRLVSVRFVMRVHCIINVFCGGIITVATAAFSCCIGVSGFVSLWVRNGIFQS